MSELGDAIREALPDIYSESECIDGCHFFLLAVPYGTAVEAHEALGELLAGASVFLVWELDCEEQRVLSVWTDPVAAQEELVRVVAFGYFGLDYEVTEFRLDEKYVPRVPMCDVLECP